MYETYFGLAAKPFQLSPDPAFYFASKGHKRAMSYLEYGMHQGEGFIVITGDVGAGKTTLVKSLFEAHRGDPIVMAQLVSTQLDAEDTLRMICAAFGLPHQDSNKAVLLKNLEGYLLALDREGKRALLVVDEAQNLSHGAVEELRMLSNFQTAERSLLQSFLLGQPEFRLLLQSESMQQLRQRVIASYHLGPMDQPETQAYIEHRLATAGWQGDPVFEPDCFALIHGFTGGIPRRINLLCDRLLLFGYLEEKHAFSAADVGEVIGDLRQEASVPAPEAVTAVEVDGETQPLFGNSIAAEMDQRLVKLEKSFVGVLRLSRSILSLSQKRVGKDG